MRQQFVPVAAVALSLLGAVGVEAQTSAPPASPPAQSGPQRGGRGQRNPAQASPGSVNQAENQVQELWNTLVLRQSKQALQLSDAQWPAFFAKLTDLQTLRARHLQARRRLIGELNRLAPPTGDVTADDATLNGKAKALDDLEQQNFQREQQARDAVDAVLTPYQRARFRVFEENMEKRKMAMLAAVLRG